MRSPDQRSAIAHSFGERSAEAETLIQTYEGFERESAENVRLNCIFRTVAFGVAVIVGCTQHRQNVDVTVIIGTQVVMSSVVLGGTWAMSRINKMIRRDMYDAFANLESLIPKDKLLTARAALDEAGIHGEHQERHAQSTTSYVRSIAQEIGEKLAPYIAALFG